jgi:hypothetical protein
MFSHTPVIEESGLPRFGQEAPVGCRDIPNETTDDDDDDDDDDNKPVWPICTVDALSGVEKDSHKPRMFSHTSVIEGQRRFVRVKGERHPEHLDTHSSTPQGDEEHPILVEGQVYL